ncbi:MAG: TOBE domain-containing protein [Thiohalocapsa sp.]|jgi:molybdate transport system regulatory protein|uniref:TOBE domain-containing protein n=1 Tax=Thiohalocapsa sp. TaxID=2497641 RepID=UPI0025D45D1A|nr:TOBE domain-containing protein [Thiohalocapsa sp.]MCG6942007.1 TOBE domain-containing protein [Thiohalocapsa sp.]
MPKQQKPPGPALRAGDHKAASPSSGAGAQPAKPPLNVAGQVWLNVDEVAFLGEERIALLEQIDARGSITQAAKAAGVSYKAAWDAVDAINNVAPAPVVTTATGGRGGGGARLTDEGRRLIAAYRTIAAEYQRFLAGVNAALGDSGAALDVLRRLALRTSARNHFMGRVAAVTARPVDAEVQIALPGGQRIVAGITNESVECLGLKPGRDVWALVKAVAIAIAPAPQEPAPGTNTLCGTVQRITRSDGPAEVVIALEGGVTVCGVIDASQLEPLGIEEQGPACAVFSTTSVIVGVDD